MKLMSFSVSCSWVIRVQMRQEHGVDFVRLRPGPPERLGKQAAHGQLRLGLTGSRLGPRHPLRVLHRHRADARVDQDRPAAGANEEASGRDVNGPVLVKYLGMDTDVQARVEHRRQPRRPVVQGGDLDVADPDACRHACLFRPVGRRMRPAVLRLRAFSPPSSIVHL